MKDKNTDKKYIIRLLLLLLLAAGIVCTLIGLAAILQFG
jgi:hypothetical protein